MEASLAEQLATLQEEMSRVELQKEILLTHVFCANRILEDLEKLQFYPSFSSRSMFTASFTFWQKTTGR